MINGQKLASMTGQADRRLRPVVGPPRAIACDPASCGCAAFKVAAPSYPWSSAAQIATKTPLAPSFRRFFQVFRRPALHGHHVRMVGGGKPEKTVNSVYEAGQNTSILRLCRQAQRWRRGCSQFRPCCPQARFTASRLPTTRAENRSIVNRIPKPPAADLASRASAGHCLPAHGPRRSVPRRKLPLRAIAGLLALAGLGWQTPPVGPAGGARGPRA